MADVAVLASWNMRAPNEAHPTSPPRVCRALFGRASDPRENLEFARREQKQIVSQQTQRWNFDFRSGTPLEGAGRFSWTKVESGENVHATYGLCRMPFISSAAAETQQEADSDHPDQKDPASSNIVEPSTSASSTPATTTLKQTNISDYMKTRKRKHSSSSSGKSTTGESSSSPKIQRALSS